MIVTNLHLQMIECSVCREAYEIPRRLMRDQHELLERVDAIKLDHRECDDYADRPDLAIASRKFRKAVQSELERAAA